MRHNMKKIEATIQFSKLGPVSDAINELVGGYSIYEGNGRGSAKRQTIPSERGTQIITAKFNKIATISTIVEDSKVQKVIAAITDAAYTGAEGDGIIVTSTIDDVVNITSKKTGLDAL